MFSNLFLISVALNGCLNVFASNIKHQYVVDIVRQETPFQQHVKHGHWDRLEELEKGNRNNDSIALRRFLDDEFYAQIVIGHPGQIVNMALDTAWDRTWVISSQCSSIKSFGCWFHNKYDHKKSSEYKKDGRPFSMNDGTFNWTGFYSYDYFSIAHSNVTTQSFIEMVTVPRSMMLIKSDGVLGLGLKTGDYNPFFYTLLQQKKIKNPMFSIYLNRDRQSKHGGNVMLGFLDQKHIHKTWVDNKTVPATIKYLNVDSTPYWQFDLDSINVNHSDVGVLCPNGCKAYVDTSSNTIVGPADDIAKIHNSINAKEFFLNRYTVDCETVNKLPKIDFVLGGESFLLEGPQYTEKMSYASITLCLSAFTPTITEQEENRWVLGGAFLAEYYSIYNIHDNKIGFVKAA